MRNIYLLSTIKPSRLSILNNGKLNFESEFIISSEAKHIYIVSDEIIKKGNFVCDGIEIFTATPKIVESQSLLNRREWKKIILTTDKDLIKYGIQAIDDNFLEWFIKNSNCEYVAIRHTEVLRAYDLYGDVLVKQYRTILPKKEKCTCTTFNDNTCEYCDLKEDEEIMLEAKLEAKDVIQKTYNQKEVLEHLNHLMSMPSSTLDTFTDKDDKVTNKWFEQFK